MHFNLHVIFSEAQIFLSLDGQEMTGHRKSTVIGVDLQNEFHLSKQVSATLRGDIPFPEEDQPLFGV